MDARGARNNMIAVLVILVMVHYFLAYIGTFIAQARQGDTTNALAGADAMLSLLQNLGDMAVYGLAGVAGFLFLMYLSKRSDESKKKKETAALRTRVAAAR